MGSKTGGNGVVPSSSSTGSSNFNPRRESIGPVVTGHQSSYGNSATGLTGGSRGIEAGGRQPIGPVVTGQSSQEALIEVLQWSYRHQRFLTTGGTGRSREIEIRHHEDKVNEHSKAMEEIKAKLVEAERKAKDAKKMQKNLKTRKNLQKKLLKPKRIKRSA